MRNVWSASAAERLIACPGSRGLQWEDKETASGKRGTRGHRYIADSLAQPFVRRAGRWPNSIDIEAIRGYINGDTFHCEQAFEYHPAANSSAMIDIKNREYPDTPGCVYGTADLIVERTGFLEVIDFKTGSDVGDPRTNWQMRTLALMAQVAYCGPPISVGVIYVDKNGDVSIDERGGVIDNGVIAETRGAIRESLAGRELIAGRHCYFCPAICLVRQ